MNRLILLLLLFGGGLFAQETDALQVTCIANEGVLIANGKTQVLIDGLYREGVSGYATIPFEMLENLEAAKAPYDEIDLVLATHLHRDHFDPRSVGRHLLNNPSATFVAGEDVVSKIQSTFSPYGNIQSQVKSIMPAWKKRITLPVSGMKLHVLRMRHGSARNHSLHHMGYLVEIGGKKILHIGDVDMTAENFQPFNLASEKIDVAFIPDWFLISKDGRNIVDNLIMPKHIVVIHIRPARLEKRRKEIKKHYPDAILFDESGKEVTF